MMRHQFAQPDPASNGPRSEPNTRFGSDPGEKLLGMRVLIVEDEALVAIDLQFAFEDAGAEVLGPAMCLKDALAMAENVTAQIDCALLDVDLAGHDVYPVAQVLQRRGIPFIFHTGHGSRRAHSEMFPGAITCLKPTLPETLIDLLAGL
jgi:DNA-binding response OmpR family regulator